MNQPAGNIDARLGQNPPLDAILFASGSDLKPATQYPRGKVRACRRCGCTENTPCWDVRLDTPCAWAEWDLCTACLGRTEFERFLRGDAKPSLISKPRK